MLPLPKEKNTIVEETLLTTEKVTTSEEVYKGTKHLDDMKEAVVTVHRKDLDNFEGPSTTTT